MKPPPYDWRDREDDEDANGQPKWPAVGILLLAAVAWGSMAVILWIAALGVAGLR